MSALDPNDARRLRSSLTRLASNHEGEVVAAAFAAARILAKAGLGFADLAIATATPEPPARGSRSEPTCGPRRRPHEVKPGRQHQARAKLLLGSGHAWDEWERKFLNSIAAWSSPLSAKQGARLAELEASRKAWLAEHGARS